jgi:coenzyme F420-reducing hydrogenase delta subunit
MRSLHGLVPLGFDRSERIHERRGRRTDYRAGLQIIPLHPPLQKGEKSFPPFPKGRPGGITRILSTKMDNNWETKILAFLCNWCSYAGADLAGTSRIQYPPNIRVIRVPCSGRINPLFILKALQGGIDGVLVSGCHPGDCHYLTGNYVGRRKSATLKRFLEYLGLEEGRVQFSWVSAAEGGKFSQVVSEVVQDVKKLGPASRFVKK